MKLSDIRSFTTFSAKKSSITAKSYIAQFERECEIMGIPEHQKLRVIPFVLHGSTLYWYQSNADKFKSYQSFKEAFIRYYQSEDMSYAKLTRLRTLSFDPKYYSSVENFVIERYNELENLMKVSRSLNYVAVL